MKNLLVLFFCAFSFTGIISAQDDAPELLDESTFGNPFIVANQTYLNGKPSKGVADKEFYINKEWKKLKVYGKDGTNMTIKSANYLIEQKLILFKNKGKTMQVFPHTVNRIVLDNTTYKAYPSVDSKDAGILGFYEVAVVGDIELVKVWSLREKAVSNNPMGIPDSNKTELVRSSKLYYKKGRNKRLEKMPRKKSDVYSLFGKKRRVVMAHASKNKLSPKKEADLIKILNFYNSKVNLEK